MANQYTNPVKQRLREWLEKDDTGWLRYTPSEIARLTSVSRSSVYNWLDILLAEIYGMRPDSFRRIRLLQSTVTDKTREEIVQDIKKEGYKRDETAYYFGLHEWHVYFVEKSLDQ